MAKLIHARDIVVKFAASVTVTTSAALPTFFSSGVAVLCKSLELNEGEADFDQQNYTGEDAAGYQNQAKVNKPKGPGELSITVDQSGLESLYALLYDKSTAISTTHLRYTNGNDTRREVSVLISQDDGTDSYSYALINAQQVAPANKLTGTDGTVEYDIKMKCLAKDLLGPEVEV